MKILVLNYEFPPLGGGASPVSFEIAENLSQSVDFDIDVVTMGYKELPEYEEVNNHFRIHRVECWRSRREICHPWEQLTYLFSAYFKCKELMKDQAFDICHCHFIIPTGLLALRLKKTFNLNYILTAHGSDVLNYDPRFKYLYPFLSGFWKMIIKNSAALTTPSFFLKQKIVDIYPVVADKIEVIPHGITSDKYQPLLKQKYILLVNRLCETKGVQDFLAALKDLDLGDWKVKIVGEGPYRQELEKINKEYNLENKVQFIGWLNNESKELQELYGWASVFVSPSWFESMNMTLLEAMRAGCAIVASDAGANPEVVGEKELFRVKDVKDLQEKIKNLISDENKIKQMGRAAQLRAENFTWGAAAGRYKKLFERYAE